MKEIKCPICDNKILVKENEKPLCNDCGWNGKKHKKPVIKRGFEI
jgi:hypothetical protein